MPSLRLSLLTLLVLTSLDALARDPYGSTYTPLPVEDLLLRGATVLTGTGEKLENSDVLIVDGKIAAVGVGLPDDGLEVVDAAGKWLTPGIIDVHSHLGAYPSPGVASTSDGNEMTSPNTAQVWVEHSVWPQDPQFPLALAGGVTSLQILPGSANLFGGRGVTLKNVPSRTVQGMKFPGAKPALKMACGENPKRVYGSKGQSPATRMGNIAGFRAAWAKARHTLDERNRQAAAADDDAEPAKPPEPDLAQDTLIGVLEGDILIHNHCYRADEMAWMIDVGKEYGFQITAFHHAVEAYKIADLLAAEGICSAMWADWWGFKLEAFDGISENVALVDQAGACAIVHSDSAVGIQRLNQEAAKALAAAQRQGMPLDEADAMTWITLNPAKALAIDDQTGSIEVGKAADLVLWNASPFSVYSQAEQVYIDGYRYYDRNDPARQPVTDFELDQTVSGGGR
jgi:imidazolonepropionase-like amidohydrolase